MSGPLPNPTRRRRNAPTIPTTNLPAGGRKGRTPRAPSWVTLGKSGKAWWSWAWSTPPAAGWASGHEPAVARRAALEDDLAALGELDEKLDLAELLGIGESNEVTERLERIIGTLKRLAGGKLAIVREMRELDDRLGLTPKGMAALRWTIKSEVEAEPVDGAVPDGVADLEQRRRRLASDA